MLFYFILCCFFIAPLHSQIALFLLWLTQELEPRIQTASELVKAQLAENDKGVFKSYDVLNISRILGAQETRYFMSHSILQLDFVPHSILQLDYVPHSILQLDYVSHSILQLDYVPHSILQLDYVPHSILQLDYVPHSILQFDSIYFIAIKNLHISDWLFLDT